MFCNRIDFFFIQVGICITNNLGDIDLCYHFGHALSDDSFSDIFVRQCCGYKGVKIIFNDSFGFVVEFRQTFDLDNVVILVRLLRLYGIVLVINLSLEIPLGRHNLLH